MPDLVSASSKSRSFSGLALSLTVLAFVWGTLVRGEEPGRPVEVSGIYPHLAMFNQENECGTGAVVPWAGKLWVVTYAPHAPQGSTDKLYEISPDLTQIVRPESIGGTPANRMIHRESNQLFIGPYVIDAQGNVRVIPYTRMFGRPTGNARHLIDPENKIYCATMEEGLYEIHVNSLEVTELWADEQRAEGRHAELPGYHGKGLYSGQGRLIYANNGEHGSQALQHPETPSGVLAEWDGQSDHWAIVRRNQFTEVTGPGGITGETESGDPVWAVGWDHRSLLLMCLHAGRWHGYRLPKASHSYDGAHGWNTEWPRIRDIGEDSLLMTMHGMFWRFPKSFSPNQSAGIVPRSTYLKVIGDFCRWGERVVFGCDDTARSEFQNKRRAKGQIAAPQSQSNLWFVPPSRLDELGPVIGRGAVWLQDDIAKNQPSDPFLIAGFERRSLQLAHESATPARIRIEVDVPGTDEWQRVAEVGLEARGSAWLDLGGYAGTWIRLVSDQPLKRGTAWFSLSNPDRRTDEADPIFDGLATETSEAGITGGLIRARAENRRTLLFAASERMPASMGPTRDLGLYELDHELKLRRVDDPQTLQYQKTHTAIPEGILENDAASIIFVDDHGRRWRLPRGAPDSQRRDPLWPMRVCREVATERDLFHAGGTFFELPAENAGGFAKIRPVTTHNRLITDYCSYRGLFIMSGMARTGDIHNSRVVTSNDGRTALWVGAIDDIWRMGKPRGQGGPWKDTDVEADHPSDPYLFTGYDRKRLSLSHRGTDAVKFRVESDVTGTGMWVPYREFTVAVGELVSHQFPPSYSAYWLRVVSDTSCLATAQFDYE